MKKYLSLLLTVLLVFGMSSAVFAEEEYTDLYIQMEVYMEDGAICADLVDDQGGTVSTWPVSLEVDGVQVDTVNTDEYGTAAFYYTIPEGTKKIACVAHNGQYDTYNFIGCTTYLDYTPPSEPDEEPEPSELEGDDTTQPAQTTTLVVVGTTTTVKNTNNVIPMTTTLKGDRVAIGVAADNALLVATQSTQSDFQAHAKMWMNKTIYDKAIPSSASTLRLQLSLNAQAGERAKLIAAKNANPAYASFTDEEVRGLAMDMEIAYVDQNTYLPLDSIEDGEYTVEMPVPASLKSCKKLAIAVCTENGLNTLYEVKPSKGVMNFTIQRFQTLAIVGFGQKATAAGSLMDTPWLLVLVIVLGLILVAGGIVLLACVVFRKKKAAPPERSAKPNTDAKKVSLDADEEDDIFVAPRRRPAPPVDPVPAAPTVPVRTEQAPVVPAETPKPSSVKADTAGDIDDLLDEVLSDLDSLDS